VQREDEARLLSAVPSARTRGSGHKREHRRLPLNIRKQQNYKIIKNTHSINLKHFLKINLNVFARLTDTTELMKLYSICRNAKPELKEPTIIDFLSKTSELLTKK